jgi:hypothetical protein
LIKTEWHTTVEGRTDAEGKFEFRGFLGQYRVKIEVGDKKSEFMGYMAKGARNRWEIGRLYENLH